MKIMKYKKWQRVLRVRVRKHNVKDVGERGKIINYKYVDTYRNIVEIADLYVLQEARSMIFFKALWKLFVRAYNYFFIISLAKTESRTIKIIRPGAES